MINLFSKTKILIIIFIFSLILNLYFIGSIYFSSFFIKNNYEQINKNFFPSYIELSDYSSVEYTLESEGIEIIKNIRFQHKVPSLIDQNFKDKEVCSGYIWSLSEKIWGNNIPYYIGMMDRETMKPSTAWELANSYIYLGGDLLINFSNKIDLSNFKNDFYNNFSNNEVLKFFNLAFTEKALFGDIGFLYNDTRHVLGLLEEGVFNSHISKNIGISKFSKQITDDSNLQKHKIVLEKIFNSNEKIINKLDKVISNYVFELNGNNIIYIDGLFYYYIDGTYIGEKVIFKLFDNISYNDVTIVHYFENIGRVNSLLEFVLKGEFYPVNIMSINGRLIEKM